MIYEGENGSINGFYKGKLIVSRPLGKHRTYERYKKETEQLIIEGLRMGHTIPQLLKISKNLIKLTRYEKMKKKPDKEDMDTILISLLMLIKFRVIEEDGKKEGLLICGRKKTKRAI
jgi:hypothetical protein